MKLSRIDYAKVGEFATKPRYVALVLVFLLTIWLVVDWGGDAEEDVEYSKQRQLSKQQQLSKQRQLLVQQIARHGHVIADNLFDSTGNFQEVVLKAMLMVPRHKFVPRNQRAYAYENRPLPIGYGQTISQPYIVALMTDLLALKKTDKVLEIGTGSGYQAAVLAEIVNEVHTIEIIPALYQRATEQLVTAGYHNVSTYLGDGYEGLPQEAPFDAIIVTAASGHIPLPLIKQLRPEGKMVIPVGSRFLVQQLILVEKSASEEVSTKQLLPVMFVPLLRGDPDEQ